MQGHAQMWMGCAQVGMQMFSINQLLFYIVILSLPGGVTLLRAAAKNHARVTVICDPVDYSMYVCF